MILKFTFSLIFILLICLSNSAHALCVNTSDASLRSGPGTKYKITWEVFKFMPFKKIGQKGNWYKIKDLDGDVHWIYKKMVTKSFKCAAVKKDKINIRSGPGTKYTAAGLHQAMKYDSYKIIRTKGLWVKVEDEFGSTGWIYKNLLWIQ